MKKYIYIIALLVGTLSVAQDPGPEADERGNRRMAKEKIEALAVAYITEKLELTPDEATQFWPVYNKMRDKRYAVERARRQLIKEMEDQFETLTDEQAKDYASKMAALEKQKYEASFEYNKDQIIAIVGAKRFLKLMKAHSDFRKKMLREYKKRRREQRKN